MVMHARKPQRIGDGYFEKHQAHLYQNNKYSSSKSSNYDHRERIRERDSPNGNSYRSESPDCDSPRDRLSSSYHSKSSSYVSKSRDRDYKSRDKYSDCVRSPKDKRCRLDSDHRTNHDRNSSEKLLLSSLKLNTQRDTSQRKVSSSCQDKRDERERVVRIGDWSEHVSSSGKKYYYNCKTEVSQWEKPREWVEVSSGGGRSSHHQSVPSRHSASSAPSTPYIHHSSHQQSNSRTAEKHSNSRVVVSGKVGGVGSGAVGVAPLVSVLARGVSTGIGQPVPVPAPVPPPTGVPPPAYWTPVSTPSLHIDSSEVRKIDSINSSGVVDGQATDMEICSGDSTPTSETCYSLIGSSSGGCEVGANAPGPPVGSSPGEREEVATEGPPTPTQESQDCKVMVCVAGSGGVGLGGGVVQPGAPSTASSSLLVGSLVGLRPQPPNLTPSLANHYRDDLVNHVRGWPADLTEKQAQKLSEEAYQLGTMCAKVSAELKCPRSVVRQTEIKATRQEQRVLFLRQQIKTLEELKSQNSFMADET